MCILLKRLSDICLCVRNMNDPCNEGYKAIGDSFLGSSYERSPPYGNVRAQLFHAFCDGEEGVLIAVQNVLLRDEDVVCGCTHTERTESIARFKHAIRTGRS